jgi:hypothetical protein
MTLAVPELTKQMLVESGDGCVDVDRKVRFQQQ